MALPHKFSPSQVVQLVISIAIAGLLDRLPVELQNCHESDFRLADDAYFTGRVVATTKNWATHWEHWSQYVQPLGLDPYLQGVQYIDRVRALTGFAADVRTGNYGRGKRVQSGMVIGALTPVGQEISLAYGENTTKLMGIN